MGSRSAWSWQQPGFRSLSPTELDQRLADSFRILSGSKAGLPRQRTLETTIEWSYDLLEPKEAELFRRASVFRGGFDLEAIEAIGAGPEVEDWEVIDLIDQLVEKSLVAVDIGAGRSRFRMLEPIRLYGRDRLAESGGTEATADAHASHFADVASRLSVDLRRHGQKEAHARLLRDIDNVRLALTRLRDTGRTDLFLSMFFDLVYFWSQASMQVEMLDLVLPVLRSRPDADAGLVVRGWCAASLLAFNLTDANAVEYGEHAIAAARQYGEGAAEGWATIFTALAIYGTTARDDAAELLEHGVALVLSDPENSWWDPEWDRMYADLALGWASDRPVPERMTKLALAIDQAKTLGDVFTAASAMTVAYFMRESDDDPVVQRHLGEAVELLGELGLRHSYGHALVYWGGITKDRDDGLTGDRAITEGAEMLAEVGDIPCSLQAIDDIVTYQLEHDQIERALGHLVFAARQASVDPGTFAMRTTAIACRAAVASRDLATAAVVLGYAGERKTSSLVDCRAAVEAGLDDDERERRSTEGAQLTDASFLELIGSWARSRLAG